MTSKIKVDNITNQSDSNIVNKCGTTITLGASGDTISLASGASQTGFGRTGTVDWDTTPKTATFSAVSGNGYFCNTSGGVFTVNLPAGSAGAIVSLADYAATWQTNNLTVTPNGTEKIGSINADVSLTVEGQSVTFVYVDSTQGWINTMDSTSNVRGSAFVEATGGTVVTCGNCKIHTFTGPGTFCVSKVACCAADNQVSYLVVAGGGGGGSGTGGNTGGGGGAGGFREDKSPTTPYTASPLEGAGTINVTATGFPITVGGGGAGSPGSISRGVSGSTSTFSTITAAVGAGGGAGSPSGPGDGVGLSGGSGGGGGGGTTLPGNSGGSGNTPPVSPPQGNPGGGARPNVAPVSDSASGGGGGAGGAGSPTPDGLAGGAGGVHINTSISGTDTEYAGGAGGGSFNNPCGTRGTPGGAGAGLSAQATTPRAGTSATSNQGSGGGGASCGNTGGAGGSGIVIIRYKFK